jgi:hypothetical protein
MTPDPDGDDLPDAEIETIRTLVGDAAWQSLSVRGALLKLAGIGVHGNSIELSVLAPVLQHFDRLVRITQAHKSGLEVKRRGPITEVKGAGHLSALAPVPGSYAIPVTLEPTQGEMVSADHEELEQVVSLITADEGVLNETLSKLPERVGDELVNLLAVADAGKVDLGVVVLRDGHVSARAEVASRTAGQRAQALQRPLSSDAGRQTLRGTLWRIDTKHHKVTIDASGTDDEPVVIATVAFEDDQLDDLKQSLREYVEVEVSIIEQRRVYEQTARSQAMKLLSIKAWSPVDDAYEAEAEAASEPASDDAELT